MSDNKTFIDSLGGKVVRLIEDNRRLRGELRRLGAEQEKLIGQRRESEERVKLLEKRIKTLETAGALAGNRGDNRAARMRVNKLLREIDNCIALINK